jgi:hypothetical protein
VGFFSKKEPAQNQGFDDTFMGVSNYRPTWWNRKPNLPDVGAQAYAWTTYALPAFTPIGAGNHAMSMRPQPFGPPPMITQQGAITVGVPVVSGQFILQPLLNPLTGT